jgi:hypothetical protein
MITATFIDIELMVKNWLLAGPVGAITQDIYQSMPGSSPCPSVICTRIGGAPMRGSDIPVDRSRISYSCWHTGRTACHTLSSTLVTEIENLAQTGGYADATGLLYVGEVINWTWLPDQASHTPRYVVDALMAAVAV